MKYFATKISENMHKTPEGYLLCIGVPIARTGEQVYGKEELPLDADGDGRIIVTRDEAEVFRPETIASFEGKSFTITHPEEFVDPENWQDLTHGTVQNVRRGEGEFADSLLADLLITTKLAIGLVENGLREVSCGYDADYIQDEAGKAKQTNIIGNHLALVDKGRAGASYAINDHQRKGQKMKLNERIKAIWARAQDEAMKAVDESAKENPQDPSSGKPSMPAGDEAYGKVMDAINALSAKVDKMAAPKAVSGDEADPEKKDDKSKEKTGDEPADMESRMKALEESVAKILEKMSVAAGDEGDEDMEEGEESEDDDFEESTMTGDAAARIEILAPGMNAKTKDAKKKALQACYATKDGKKAIEAFTGGKTPTFDSAEKVDSLFIGVSELLKVSRTKELAETKQGTRDSAIAAESKVVTAEMMNEINAKHYKRA